MKRELKYTAVWQSLGIIIFFQLVAGILVLSYISIAGPNSPTGRVYTSLIQIFSQIICLIIPTWYIAKKSEYGLIEALRLRLPSISSFFYALIGFCGAFALFSGISIVIENILPAPILDFYIKGINSTFESYKNLLGWRNSGEFILAVLAGAMLPAIGEEMLFRGYAQRSAERISPKNAIIIVSILFAAVHFNPMQFPELLVIGLYLAFAAYYSGSIIVPIAVHFTNNFVMVLSINSQSEASISDTPLSYGIAMIFLGFLVAYVGLTLMRNRRYHYID